VDIENLVDGLIVASASRSPAWQIIPERGVVKSREPFKFWWALTIYLERLKLEWSNFARRYTDDKLPLKGRGQNHVTHFKFWGRQLYLWNC